MPSAMELSPEVKRKPWWVRLWRWIRGRWSWRGKGNAAAVSLHGPDVQIRGAIRFGADPFPPQPKESTP